jgi:membrane fusion protein (multidrug efflux system)
MNRIKIIIGCIVAIAAVVAVVALVKSRGEADSNDTTDKGDATPTVVTVQTGVLKLATLHRYISGFGTVEPAPATADQPAASAPLAAPSAGVVTKINVVEGQHVEQGEVLMELNSGTMTAAGAAQQVERQKELYAKQNTSLKNLQDAETQLALLRVTAPLSGIVTRVNVKPGQAVDLTTVVAEIMDLNRLAVSAEIPAAAAGELKTGEELQISESNFQQMNGQDAHSTTAAVSFVSPAVDANNGTVLVRAALPAGTGLRPGQFVPLRIVTAVHTNGLAAPEAGVVTDISGRSVFALVNSDEALQTLVQTGFRENGLVEIAAPGLKVGDIVVTVGAYGLPNKTKIRVENSSGDETSTNPPAAQ